MEGTDEIVGRKSLTSGIIVDAEGTIVKALELGDEVELLDYANGEREIVDRKTGTSLTGRYRALTL